MRTDPGNQPDGNGYHYGGYYYGGSYGDSSDSAFNPHRGIRDILMLIRERIWWLIVIVSIVFVCAVAYTLNATEMYLSSATVQILREQDRGVEFQDVVDMSVRNTEDFNTQIKVLESIQVVQRVAERIQDSRLHGFMQPYEDQRFFWREARSLPEILVSNRSVSPVRLTLVVEIKYRHPDPEIAAYVANLFAEEFINFNLGLRMEGTWRAVDDLRARADQQQDKVEELDMQLAEFKERHKSVSFDAATDMDQQELIRLNEIRTTYKRVLDEAQTQWNMIERMREEGRPLWEARVISGAPRVADLLSRRAAQNIELAALSKQYRHRHPRMIEAVESMDQIERELQEAVVAAAELVRNNLQEARENFSKAQERIENKREEIIAMQKVRVQYSSLLRNLRVNQELYEYLYSRMQQAMAQASDDAQTARIVDRAVPAVFPHSPNTMLNLAVGLFGGLVVGFGFVFLLAFFDDKVKTAFDIESAIGLPLLGIVSRIPRMEAQQKARVVLEAGDAHAVEGFRSIYSTLKLHEEHRNAKCILTTSTIPGEGKSFVTTNFALTCGGHGERTIIVDADLRMPNIANSLGLENKNGLLQFLRGERSLDSVIVRDYAPNVDVLATGGRTKSPTQILGTDAFLNLIHELRMRYDKIVIDSPPVAPVSDALNMIPMVDGVLYVIRFNAVKRRTAHNCVRRLSESNVAVMGAILNDISTSVAGYYYSHYYDKSYSDYYVAGSDDAPDNEPASKPPAEPARL